MDAGHKIDSTLLGPNSIPSSVKIQLGGGLLGKCRCRLELSNDEVAFGKNPRG